MLVAAPTEKVKVSPLAVAVVDMEKSRVLPTAVLILLIPTKNLALAAKAVTNVTGTDPLFVAAVETRVAEDDWNCVEPSHCTGEEAAHPTTTIPSNHSLTIDCMVVVIILYL